jgi:putative holliday junction resolvase
VYKSILCLDVGKARIGSAFYMKKIDASWPLETVRIKDFMTWFSNVIKEKEIDTVVVGWPILMNGDESLQCEFVEQFVQKMKQVWPGEIHKFDERLSTSASMSLYGFDDDSISAMIILEGFVCNIKNTEVL